MSEEFALGVLSPGSVSPEEGLGLICIRKIVPNDCVLEGAEGFCRGLCEVQGSELEIWRGPGDLMGRIEPAGWTWPCEVGGAGKPELSASLGSSVGWVWRPMFSVWGRCRPWRVEGVFISLLRGATQGGSLWTVTTQGRRRPCRACRQR